jgi:hypothetical protein
VSDLHLLRTLERVVWAESSAYGGPRTARCTNAWRTLKRLSRHGNTDAQATIEQLQGFGFGPEDGATVRFGAEP